MNKNHQKQIQNDWLFFKKSTKIKDLCKAYKGHVLTVRADFFCTALFTVSKYVIVSNWSATSRDWLGFHNFLWATCLHLFSFFRPHVQATFCFSFKGTSQNLLFRDGVMPLHSRWKASRHLAQKRIWLCLKVKPVYHPLQILTKPEKKVKPLDVSLTTRSYN